MRLELALLAMQRNKKIRRTAWESPTFYIGIETFTDTNILSLQDVFADDWEIIDEI